MTNVTPTTPQQLATQAGFPPITRQDGYDEIAFRDRNYPQIAGWVSRSDDESFWRITLEVPPLRLTERDLDPEFHLAAARMAVRVGLCTLRMNGAGLTPEEAQR